MDPLHEANFICVTERQQSTKCGYHDAEPKRERRQVVAAGFALGSAIIGQAVEDGRLEAKISETVHVSDLIFDSYS